MRLRAGQQIARIQTGGMHANRDPVRGHAAAARRPARMAPARSRACLDGARACRPPAARRRYPAAID